MTENLSTNIKDYTDQDLLNILNLSDDCSEFEIKQATNSLIKSMKKANKQDLVKFFMQVQTYLLEQRDPEYAETYNKQFDENTMIGNMYENEYLTQKDSTQTDKYTERKQKVEFFQENAHMPMSRQRLGVQQTHNVAVAQGTMNPLLRTTTKRIANIDSQYRPNIYPYVNNNPDSVASSTNFTINLSEPLNNAISSTLYSIQIPRTWYVFDENLGNTCFWIQNSDEIDVGINITPGNYSSPTNLVAEINSKIAAALSESYAPTDLNDITFNYDETKNKIYITSTDSSGVSVIFYSDDRVYTCPETCTQEISINQTLGWLLGFRPQEELENNIFRLSLDGSGSYYAEAALDMYGPKYFLLVLDDYNQNHLNKGLINIVDTSTKLDIPSYYHKAKSITLENGQKSNYDCSKSNTLGLIKPSVPRRLTKAQLHTVNEIIKDRNEMSNRSSGPNPSDVFGLIPINLTDTTSQKMLIEYGSNLQYNNREYFGPVDIERLRVRLVDDKGNTVNLHGADWSFSFIVEQLYQY